MTAGYFADDAMLRRVNRERLPPAIVRKALVAGRAEHVKRAVVPVLPDRLRLVDPTLPATAR